MTDNYQAIVLAAGKGTRIGATEFPKVMFRAAGKPLLEYVLDTLMNAGIDKPIIVVGFKAEKVTEIYGDRGVFVTQDPQLGTAHAVLQAEQKLKDHAGATFILYGDMPLIKASTLSSMRTKYEQTGADLLITTIVVDDPDELAFGRILRDRDGKVTGVIEQKLATEEQRRIKELNVGVYLVNNEWLWQTIKKIEQTYGDEYPLTDLIELAVREGKKIVSYKMHDQDETLGVNTKEQLARAEEIVRGSKE